MQVVSPDWSRTVMSPSHWPSLDRCQAGETRDTIEDDTDTEGMKVHKSDDGCHVMLVSAIVITSVAVTVWVSLLTLG